MVAGHNVALVDLFDLRHAKRVLAAFGRAYESLPADPQQTTEEQQRFLDQAVASLAEDGKVVCVRLTLLAEMMKGKPWQPAVLRELGGAEGLGAMFLEETFVAQAGRPALPAQHGRRPAGVESPAAAAGNRYQRSHAVPRRVAGSFRLRQEGCQVRRIAADSGRRIAVGDADGPGRDDGEAKPVQTEGGEEGRNHYVLRRAQPQLLSADARLSGPVAAGMAGPQSSGKHAAAGPKSAWPTGPSSGVPGPKPSSCRRFRNGWACAR